MPLPQVLIATALVLATAGWARADSSDSSAAASEQRSKQTVQQQPSRTTSKAGASASASASSSSRTGAAGCRSMADSSATVSRDGRVVSQQRHDEATGTGECSARSSASAGRPAKP